MASSVSQVTQGTERLSYHPAKSASEIVAQGLYSKALGWGGGYHSLILAHIESSSTCANGP